MILDLARPSNVLAIHRLRRQPLHAAMNDSVDVRYGVTRASQAKNVLLMPPALGKAKPRTSTVRGPPEPGFTFGQKRIRDAENASQVTMRWQTHKPPVDQLPGPDFKTMNKLAAVNDVVTAKETKAFREENVVTLRAGAGATSDPGGSDLFVKPSLPSDGNPEHRYGKSSKQRTVEELKWGSMDGVKEMINGDFQHEWANANEKRLPALKAMSRKPKPVSKTTKAMECIAAVAQSKIAPAPKSKQFKMKLFNDVPSRFRG